MVLCFSIQRSLRPAFRPLVGRNQAEYLIINCKSTQIYLYPLVFARIILSMKWANLCYITHFKPISFGDKMKTPYLCVRFQTETALILKLQQEESACEGRSEEAVANGLGGNHCSRWGQSQIVFTKIELHD
ncbi:hypothetical protein EVA_02313 [gut metagenome]|uniref:Uncharacterized protein n=1 Tax=gut metagenome TaxID=749906 RepID=J9GNB8_9ZZZZ